MFNVDITLAIQFVNFVVTIVVLDFLLIRPIRGIVKKRRDLASGLLSDAETFTAEAAQKLENYETTLSKAREEAARICDERKNEGVSKEAELLSAAQNDAQSFLQSSRESTRAATAQTMAEMEKRIPALSAMVAAQLTGKSKRSSAA